MKTFAFVLLLTATAAFAQPAAPSSVTAAQAATTTTSTIITPPPNEVSGNIIAYKPDSAILVVQVPGVTAPVTYKTNSSTSLVDYANKHITVGHLQSTLPITVFFDPATPTVASKVVLREYAKPIQ